MQEKETQTTQVTTTKGRVKDDDEPAKKGKNGREVIEEVDEEVSMKAILREIKSSSNKAEKAFGELEERMSAEIGDVTKRLNKVQKAMKEGVNVTFAGLFEYYDELDKDEKNLVSKKLRDIEHADGNWLERGIYAAEEWTGGWLRSIGKAGLYASTVYGVGALAVHGGKFVVKAVRGDAAGAAQEIHDATMEILD